MSFLPPFFHTLPSPHHPPHPNFPPQQTQASNLCLFFPTSLAVTTAWKQRDRESYGITLYLLAGEVLFLPNNTSCLFLHVSQLRTNSFFSNCLLYHRLPGPQIIQPFILSSAGIRDAISFLPPHRCQKHLGMPLPESSEFPEQSLDNANLTLQR